MLRKRQALYAQIACSDAWPKGNPQPSAPVRPYGLAIMSIACTMIETLESHRRGIPTTNRDDFKYSIKTHNLFAKCPYAFRFAATEIPGTGAAFKSFFGQPRNEFPGIDGQTFFSNVRNALLHQSQTRNGWILNIHHPDEALSKAYEIIVGKILYRDSFVKRLHDCFTIFVKDLRAAPADRTKWKSPERKIWRIAWLSDPEKATKWWYANAQGAHKSLKNLAGKPAP